MKDTRTNPFVRIFAALLAIVTLMSSLPIAILADGFAESGEQAGNSASGNTTPIPELEWETITMPGSGLGDESDNAAAGDIIVTQDAFQLRLNKDEKSWTVVGYLASYPEMYIPSSYRDPVSLETYPVTRIEEYAFENKVNLHTVTIPESIQYIGTEAFAGCDNLDFEEYEGVQYLGNPQNPYLYLYRATKKDATTVTVFDSTKEETQSIRLEHPNAKTRFVASKAFYDLEKLESIHIPNTVEQIGFKALRHTMDHLHTVSLPFCGETGSGLTNSHLGFIFGARTFGGNISYVPESLRAVHINGGTRMSQKSFFGIDFITTLTLPFAGDRLSGGSVPYVSHIWGGTTSSDNAFLPATLTTLTILGGDIGASALEGCVGLTSITIPDSVTSIGDSAFYKCISLTSITIPDSVTSIGDSAFYKCISLTSITIPDSVTSIGEDVFYDCDSLASVSIGDSVTSIGGSAFSFCSSLTSITIPNSVTSIGSFAFSGCLLLTIYAEAKEQPAGWSSYWNTNNRPVVWGYTGETETALAEDTTTQARLVKREIPRQIAPLSATVEDDGNGLAYRLNGDGESYTVTGIGTFTGTDLVIPGTYLGKPVTSIGNHAFYNCSALTSITIPDSVTSIGNYAFSDCTSLDSVTIPDSVTSIGSSAFYRCSSLTSVIIGNSVTSIGDYAFYGCTKLANASFGENSQLASIGYNAFYDCSSLTSVTIPDSVTSIGSYAFLGCSSLTSLTLPTMEQTLSYLFSSVPTSLKEVTVLGGNICNFAFSGCTSLASVTIGNSVTSIGYAAFSGCSSLASVTIGNSVTSIGEYAFSYCSSLDSVAIGDSVTSIGDEAFSGCSSLTSIIIPDSVTSIGDYAFYICHALKEVHIQSIEAWCKIDFVSSDSNPLSYAHNLYWNGSLVTDLVIPNSVTSIGNYAFSGCTSLASVTIPDSVTSIGEDVFRGCSSLTSLTLPTMEQTLSYLFDSVPSSLKEVTVLGGTTICASAFESCGYIVSITIPDSITSVEYEAFYNCSSLTSITIPDSVTSIGKDAFQYCSSLQYNVKDGVYYLGNATNLYAAVIDADASITSVVLPNGVKCIGYEAFYNCTSLAFVSIPDSVTNIGYKAFYDCSSLTSITIPDSVTSIGYSAFSYCSSLTSVTIGDSVTSIGSYAFEDCSSLTSVTIGDSVTSIGSGAFSGCYSLKEVYIQSIEAWCKIDFANSDSNPLYYAHNLYWNGSLVTDLVIPDSVTSIGDYAFYGCTTLERVTFPNTLSYIGQQAFGACDNFDYAMYHGERREWRCVTKATNWRSGSAHFEVAFSKENSGLLFEMNENETEFYVGEYDHTMLPAEDAGIVEIPAMFSGRAVREIWEKAFYNNSHVVSIQIPDTVHTIKAQAFANASRLEHIVIPDSVTTLGFGILAGCNCLTSLTTPFVGETEADQEHTYMGYLFGGTGAQFNGDVVPTSLIAVTITGNGSIGDYMFYDCSHLVNVQFTGKPTAIGDYAFANCNGMNAFVIPDSVTDIGHSILAGCNNVTYIYLGKGFSGTSDAEQGAPLFGLNKSVSHLATYEVSEYNSAYMTDKYGVLYETLPVHYTGGVSYIPVGVVDAPAGANLANYLFPSHVVNIYPYAFAYNTSLTTIRPYDIRMIGDYAFYGATGLIRVELERSDTIQSDNPDANDTAIWDAINALGVRYSQYIGKYAFMGCQNLQYINLDSEMIVGIGDGAFYDCGALKTVRFGDGIQSLGQQVFATSSAMGSSLEQFWVHGDNTHFKSIDGVLYRKNQDATLTLVQYPACKPRLALAEDGMEYVYAPERDAHNNILLWVTSFAIPAKDDAGADVHVAQIESFAFRDARYLRDLALTGNKSLAVGDYAFGGVLERVTVGKQVTTLGIKRGEGEYTVFANCDYLTEIKVEAGNRYYADFAGVLYNQDYTRLIKYPAQRAGDKYVLPDTVKVISSMAFKGNNKLKGVTITSTLDAVGLEAFYNCKELAVIFFDDCWAPSAIMENAFTTYYAADKAGMSGAGEGYTIIGYQGDHYNNGDATEGVGWETYAASYRLTLMGQMPEVNTPRSNGYYAIVVVDKEGNRVTSDLHNGNTALLVSLTDPNGVTETVYVGTDAQGMGDGVAVFYDLFGAVQLGFSLDFDAPYTLRVQSLDGTYFNYTSENFYLDEWMRTTYVTLVDMPDISGVSIGDFDINTETAVINKQEYGNQTVMELIDQTGTYTEDNIRCISIPETLPVTLIAYFTKGELELLETGHYLAQNGTPVPESTLTSVEFLETVGEKGSALITFQVPVTSLIPEVEVEAYVAFHEVEADREASIRVHLNINVIDFTIAEEDIHLESEELTMDMSQGGDIFAQLIGSKDWTFKLGDNVDISTIIEGDTVTLALNAKYSKSKKSATKNYEQGYRENTSGSHHGNTWRFHFVGYVYDKESEELHTYTMNIYFAKGSIREGYVYYRCSVNEQVNGRQENRNLFYGVVQANNSRFSCAVKAEMIYLQYFAAACKAGDVMKGEKYVENIEGVSKPTNSHEFGLNFYGDIVFQYQKGKGIVPVKTKLEGKIHYTYQHFSQFTVWVIPVTVEIGVNLEGKVTLNLQYNGWESVSIKDAQAVISARVSAEVGIGCCILGAGVYGSVGTMFVLDFAPEFGVKEWSVDAEFGVWVKFLFWKKKATLLSQKWYIIGGEKDAKKMAALELASTYLMDSYEVGGEGVCDEQAQFVVMGDTLYKVHFIVVDKGDPVDNQEGETVSPVLTKLAVSQWDVADMEWSEPRIIDDNGQGDMDYRLYQEGGNVHMVYTQRTSTGTTADIYDFATGAAVKYVNLGNMTAQNADPVILSETVDYKYLSAIGVVDGKVTVAWAENADNNIFGVSPKNYIDANGTSYVYPTVANSIYMTQWNGQTWETPVLVASGLSAVTDLAVDATGHVVYIVDRDGDLAGTGDRVAYEYAVLNGKPTSINEDTPGSIIGFTQSRGDLLYTTVDADGDKITAYKPDGKSEVLELPPHIMNLGERYQLLYDADGNLNAVLFVQNKNWQEEEGGATVTGAALYGAFLENGEWGQVVELSSEAIAPVAGAYISHFNATWAPQTTGGLSSHTMLLAVEYTGEDGGNLANITVKYSKASILTLEEYDIQYSLGSLDLSIVNEGSLATSIVAEITYVNKEGETETVSLTLHDNIASGEHLQLSLDLKAYGLTPVVVLKDGTTKEEFHTFNDLDFNHSDVRPLVKQLLLGSNNTLLVAVGNYGNLTNDATLYIKVGEHTEESFEKSIEKSITENEKDFYSVEIPEVTPGAILVPIEVLLSEIPGGNSITENTVVTLYVKADDATLEKGDAGDNNLLHTTVKQYVQMKDTVDMGTYYIPELDKYTLRVDRKTEEDAVLRYSAWDEDGIASVRLNDTILTNGIDYIVTKDTLTIYASAFASLEAGKDHALYVAFQKGTTLTVSVKVKAYYIITWQDHNGKKLGTTEVGEGEVPKFTPPTLDAGEDVTYTFKGWSAVDVENGVIANPKSFTVGIASKDATYRAVYETNVRMYTITWVVQGEVFQEQYAWDTPAEEVTFKGLLDKPADENYTYTFIRWDSSVETVKKDATYTAVYAATELTSTIMGDVNMDGVVNTLDLALLRQSVVGIATLDDEQRKRADVNGDGNTNTLDVGLLQQLIVGLLSSLV